MTGKILCFMLMQVKRKDQFLETRTLIEGLVEHTQVKGTCAEKVMVHKGYQGIYNPKKNNDDDWCEGIIPSLYMMC